MGKTKKHYIGIDELLELFMEYRAIVKNKPKQVEDYVGKDGKRVFREREAPLTLVGFELYVWEKKKCRCTQYFYGTSAGDHSAYKDVAELIQMYIKDDQITGGMTNIYNYSITARLNGLVDKKEENGTKDVTIKVTYGNKGSGTQPATHSASEDTE